MVVIPPPPAVAPSETINPANGNVLATVQAAGREGCRSRREGVPNRGKNLGGDDRYGALRVFCVGLLIFCVNAMTNSQNWKPSTPEKHIPETSTVDIVTGADVQSTTPG